MILADIEDAITQRLTAAAGEGAGQLGYKLTVDGYGGEFDSEADLETARLKFPCALILLKEVGRGTDVGGGQKVPLTYTIFVAAQNRRGARARRRGAVGEVGTYQMAWDIRQLLKGQDLGLGDHIDALRPGPMVSILNGAVNTRSVSVYACTFTTTWYEDLTPLSADEMGDFLELDTSWDIPPHAHQTTWPPAHEDARDLIKPRETLPQ